MSWSLVWMVHKRDQRGKHHLYGTITVGQDAYRVYGECKSAHMHMNRIHWSFEIPRSTRSTKLTQGWKDISMERIKSSFPEVIRDIEIQLSMKVLKDAL